MIFINFLMPCLTVKSSEQKQQQNTLPQAKKVECYIKKSRPFDCFEELQNMTEPCWGKNDR